MQWGRIRPFVCGKSKLSLLSDFLLLYWKWANKIHYFLSGTAPSKAEIQWGEWHLAMQPHLMNTTHFIHFHHTILNNVTNGQWSEPLFGLFCIKWIWLCPESKQNMSKWINSNNVYIFMVVWRQHLWREAVHNIKRNSVRNAKCLLDCLIFKAPRSDM